MLDIQPQEFWFLLPEMVLAAMGLILLLFGTMRGGSSHGDAAAVSLLGLGACGALLVWGQGFVTGSRVILAGMFVVDGFAFYWKLVVLLATAITILLSLRFVEEGAYRAGEYYALLLFATTGMMLMASGYSLLSIWVSLELMALSSYVLTGYFKRHRRSNEAALKYFVLGAVSSGILLYGISLIYGGAGTIQLGELARALARGTEGDLLLTFGWMLLAAGLLFKVAAVPFHVWTPDVYVGAPTPVTAYLAAASKVASFAILARILIQGLPGVAPDWSLVLAVVAILTMVWGNLAALTQENVKRMLAYSSIAHAGYSLIGVLALNAVGLKALLFYLLTYSFITLGAFGTVIMLERKEYAGEVCADYAGLHRRAPLLAALMVIFLLGLTGIPPTGGFVGKLYLFAAAVKAGWTWVAVVGVLMSAVSVYYYFRIVVYMYQHDEREETPMPAKSGLLVAGVAICALVTLVMGLYPQPFFALATSSLLPLP